MTTILPELLDQLGKLDESQQQQILAYARQLTKPNPVSWEQWLEQSGQFQAVLRNKYGEHHFFDSRSLLDEVREERLNELMGDN